jgi:hypothetical protein
LAVAVAEAVAVAVAEAVAVAVEGVDSNGISHNWKELIAQYCQTAERVRNEQLYYGGKNNDSLYRE